MKANFELPRPGNWMSFEQLCLKVWAHIWQIPNTISFNSTNDQGQDGVDIIGIPKGEIGYFGIQCKNKQLHLKSGKTNTLSKKLITDEIANAESFSPALEHLVIATSLSKDKEIETFVREINIERIRHNLFSIQICFWDFISEKIQENEILTNWYLANGDLTTSYAVEILLDNGRKEKLFHPDYIMEIQNHRHITKEEQEEETKSLKEVFDELGKDKVLYTRKERFLYRLDGWKPFRNKDKIDTVTLTSINGKPAEQKYPYQLLRDQAFRLRMDEIDHQPLCYFKLCIKNTGSKPIENYRIEFDLLGKYSKFGIVGPRITEAINKTYQQHSRIIEGNRGYIKPPENILVQNDSFLSYSFFIDPIITEESEIIISWKLIAKDFNDSGSLLLKIKPVYERIESVWIIHPDTQPSKKYVFRYKRIKGMIQPNF